MTTLGKRSLKPSGELRPPRKIRKDSKLGHLPEEQKEKIENWLRKSGEDRCVARIKAEFGIEVSVRTVYSSVRRWRLQACFIKLEEDARAQVEAEAKKRGGMSFEEMEECIDRKFIAMASDAENPKLYKELRYLRIADQAAKSHQRIAEAKLKQGATNLRHRAKALELAERKLLMTEKKSAEAKQAARNKTLSAEERARRVREILQ